VGGKKGKGLHKNRKGMLPTALSVKKRQKEHRGKTKVGPKGILEEGDLGEKRSMSNAHLPKETVLRGD